MSIAKVDIIIFGATGFTGKFIVQECANRNHEPAQFTWAIAGRNVDKMKQLLEEISLKIGKDLTTTPIIVADCSNEDSLNEMAKCGKVIINCSGPFRFYGEPVVKACIENGAHYVDVCGEPEFMDKMQLLYHDAAEANGCYVISSCGMDSVPVDLGVIHFMKNFQGQVNYIESYMKMATNADKYKPLVNTTTWESAVHGYANQGNLIEIRKQLFSKMRKLKPQPSIPRRPTVHRSTLFDNNYSIPFPGADRSVVVRTQMHLYNYRNLRPVQFNAYLICGSLPILFALFVVGYILQTLTKYNFGRKLLLKFPETFSLGIASRNNLSEDALERTTAQFKFYGEGWSPEFLQNADEPKLVTDETDSSMITELLLQSPAYGFTSVCVVLCALTILKETDKLPSKGGVYSPGGAFYETDIIENFQKRGVIYQVVERKNKINS